MDGFSEHDAHIAVILGNFAMNRAAKPLRDRNPNTRTNLLLSLGQCLSVDASPAAIAGVRHTLLAGQIDWLRFVEIANGELVTPALWSRLRHKGLIDALEAELRSYLAEIYRLNLTRNQAIRAQACEAVRALNARGVVPAVLKGGLHLFCRGLDAGARMMADLDLLVRAGEMAASDRALRALGYVPIETDDSRAPHARTFVREGVLATIDVHFRVGPQRSVLVPDKAWATATALDCGELLLVALSPTHRALHSILNGTVFARYQRSGVIPLRLLHDFTTLSEHGRGQIDWSAIESVMDRHGLGHVLRAWLHIATCLLGFERLPEVRGDMRARLYLQRCFLQLRSPMMMSLGRGWGWATWPFDRVRMDNLYGCGSRGAGLAAFRLRHALGALPRAWARTEALAGLRLGQS